MNTKSAVRSILFTLAAVVVGAVCLGQVEEKEQIAVPDTDGLSLVVYGALDDAWTKWIVGEWGRFREPGSKQERKGWMKAELALNGQFLVIRHENVITDEDIESLRESMQAEDEQAAKFKQRTHKEIEYYTIDPKTGEVVGYLFDSLRCVAVGRGTRQGKKEVVTWKWQCGGRDTISIRTTEKIDDNRLLMTDKYLKSDGSTLMVGTLEATRTK